MPRFEKLQDPIEFDIYPDEYVDKCTSSEIGDLIRTIKREYPIIFDGEIEDEVERQVESAVEEKIQEMEGEDPRSDGQRIFNYHLSILKQEWYSVTKEDADIIAILAKKYGAV